MREKGIDKYAYAQTTEGNTQTTMCTETTR